MVLLDEPDAAEGDKPMDKVPEEIREAGLAVTIPPKQQASYEVPVPEPLPPGWVRGSSLSSLKNAKLTLEEKVWLGNLHVVHGAGIARIAEQTKLPYNSVKKHVGLAREYASFPAGDAPASDRAINRGSSFIWTDAALARVSAAVNAAEESGSGKRGSGKKAVDAAIRQIHEEQRASIVVQPKKAAAIKGARLSAKDLPMSASYIRSVKNRAAVAEAKRTKTLEDSSTL